MHVLSAPVLPSASPRQPGRQPVANLRSSYSKPLVFVARSTVQPSNAAPSISYDAAAQLMWDHYKVRKALFITDIRLYREGIIAALVAGMSPDAAFEPFLRPADEAVPAAKRRGRVG